MRKSRDSVPGHDVFRSSVHAGPCGPVSNTDASAHVSGPWQAKVAGRVESVR